MTTIKLVGVLAGMKTVEAFSRTVLADPTMPQVELAWPGITTLQVTVHSAVPNRMASTAQWPLKCTSANCQQSDFAGGKVP